MAKGQQGISATTVWMIVFCFFWLVSTVWLVIMYTGQEELRTANARLQREARTVASAEELRSIEQVKAASENGPTAVGLIEEARSKTAELATGEPKDGVGAVRTKRDELLRAITRDAFVDNPEAFADVSLLGGFSQLYESFKKEHARRELAESRLEQLDAEVGKLAELNAQQKSDFEKRTLEMQDRMNTIESERSAYRAEKDGVLASMTKDFDLRRTQTDADLTAERQKNRAAEGLLKEMKARLVAERNKQGDFQVGPGELPTARQPDGQILTAVTGDEIVYINLGSADRLVLGLQFAVYSASGGIPEDGRSKAQIEVVSITSGSAECRVLRVAPGDVIIEGDWIANPVYDKSRSPSFLVLGEFDLNRDGTSDAGGRDIVESIIRNWGGTLVDDVNALTDFVVVGATPPKPKSIANPTPEQSARSDSMQRARERYLTLLSAAQALAVPTMTQDVFLNFLGHPARLARH